MLAINGSTHLMPRVEDPDDGGTTKMFGQRRRSSALDMSLMTVYVLCLNACNAERVLIEHSEPNLKQGYQVVETGQSQANLAAFQAL